MTLIKNLPIKARLLEAYRQHGDMTDEEVSRAADVRYTSVQQPRLWLIEDGLVEAKGKKKQTTSGYWATVYGVKRG